MNTKSSPIWVTALLDIMPLSLAVIPWGILTGSLAIEVGLTPLQAQCMSLFVFAGAAQLASLNLLQLASPISSILASTFVISSRHLLYSAVFRRFAMSLPWYKRYPLAFLLTDEMFVVAENRRSKMGSFNFQYAVVAGLGFHFIWNVSTFLGIVLGSTINNLSDFGFEFAIAAIFIAMVIPLVKTSATFIAVLTSGVVVAVCEIFQVPNSILIAGVTGMAAGFGVEQYRGGAL
jgi:branched chain amino acid efflux pump